MKGVLFKYGADPKSPELYDSKSDHCDLMDPDFVSNKQPVWSICGPYVRQKLEQGDVLFFIPQKDRLIRAGLPPNYICTGVLVVSAIIKHGGRRLDDPRITEKYRRQYVWSYKRHLKGNGKEMGDEKRAPRTAKIRGFNIILGDPEKSIWLRRPWPPVEPVYRGVGLPPEYLSYQRIPYVKNAGAVEKLYKGFTGRRLQ
jgi:hypothetical protein